MHGDYGVPPRPRWLRLDAEDHRPPPALLVFDYVNWREERHRYAIQVESISFGRPAGAEFTPGAARWHLNGWVVTRDDDPRPEMGTNRRRSFLLTEIYNVQEREESR